MKKTLEEITAEEIIKTITNETKKCPMEDLGENMKGHLVYIISEILSEYADNWARDNAKDYMIDHAYP